LQQAVGSKGGGEMRSKRITEFCKSTEVFPNQYGSVNFHAWLVREQNRFFKHGVKTEIKLRRGEMALVRT